METMKEMPACVKLSAFWHSFLGAIWHHRLALAYGSSEVAV